MRPDNPIQRRKTRAAILLIVILGCSFSAVEKYKPKDRQVTVVRSVFRWQMPTATGELLTISDSVDIYYYRDLVLYKVGNLFDVWKAGYDSITGNISNDSLSEEGIRYKYFIYKRGANFGCRYDSINSTDAGRFGVDSFLASQLSFQEKMFLNDDDSLLAVMALSNDGLLKKLVPKIKYDV